MGRAMFGKKKTTVELCSICGEPAVLTKPSKLDKDAPAAVFIVNEHSHPFAEVPFILYLCAEHANTMAGFAVYLMEEQKKIEKERELMERLKTLDVGTVLTVVEEHPHPMPTKDMKELLENSPFSQIWKQEL